MVAPVVAVAQIKITLPFQKTPSQTQVPTAQNTDAAHFQWHEDVRVA